MRASEPSPHVEPSGLGTAGCLPLHRYPAGLLGHKELQFVSSRRSKDELRCQRSADVSARGSYPATGGAGAAQRGVAGPCTAGAADARCCRGIRYS
eukprot:6201124-Pleurochrysis_carterae.AAC.1